MANGHDWSLRSVVDVYYRVGVSTRRVRIVVKRVTRRKAVFSVHSRDGVQRITLPYLGVFHINHGDTLKCSVAVLNDIADGSNTVDLGFEANDNVTIYRTDFWGNTYAN